MNKNLSLLALSLVFGFTANIITVFLSGIVGSHITSIKSLSTLPTALAVVGTAIFTILAAKIMGKIGRRLGFIFGTLVSSATCLLSVFAIIQQNFILFCISCLILGMGAAFNLQNRFAAAESVEKEKVRPSLEPAHAFSEAFKIAPRLSKDTIICVDSCGDQTKDSKIIKERLGYNL